MKQELAPLLETLNHPSLPGIDLSLERMHQLMAALGHPERKLPPVIHVAGTNGKGSTIAYLRAMYEAAGYHVHSYTSPHLVRFNERIVISGQEASDALLVPYLERIAKLSKKIPVTFFEATTAAAFLAFAAHHADIVLLETGLGGRLDATNIVEKPIASVITPIGYDHQEYLGNSLAAIAQEKAGIIKPHVPVFSSSQQTEAFEVLKSSAALQHASLTAHGTDWQYAIDGVSLVVHAPHGIWRGALPALVGNHQIANAALAVVTALSVHRLMPITHAAIENGLQQARWPARLQQLTRGALVAHWKGEVWLDGGHNAHAAIALAEWVQSRSSPVAMIVGMMQRKDAMAFFHPFADLTLPIVTIPIPNQTDVYSADQLAKAAKLAGCTQVMMAASLEEAAHQLACRQDGVLLVTGSLFLAGEVLKSHA